jgi:hypothetical protein
VDEDEGHQNAPGNAPRTWKDYIMYPRVLLTLVLMLLVVLLAISFGVYAMFFEK